MEKFGKIKEKFFHRNLFIKNFEKKVPMVNEVCDYFFDQLKLDDKQ
jgi:hypothetical protein